MPTLFNGTGSKSHHFSNYGNLHGRQMDLILNNAPDEQRRELSEQSGIGQQILNDIKNIAEIMKATYTQEGNRRKRTTST